MMHTQDLRCRHLADRPLTNTRIHERFEDPLRLGDSHLGELLLLHPLARDVSEGVAFGRFRFTSFCARSDTACEQLSCFVAAIARECQIHVGIGAHREHVLPILKAIPEAPQFCAVRFDEQSQPGTVGELIRRFSCLGVTYFRDREHSEPNPSFVWLPV